MGGNNLIEITGTQQFAEIEKIYLHPDYKLDRGDFDVALIKLFHPLLMTDYVSTVCVPGVDMDPLFDTGTNVTVSGWGFTEDMG